MSPPAAGVSSAFGGPEPWNDVHNLALGRAWYGVSASPLGLGAANKKSPFWKHVLTAYHVIYRTLGGNVAPTPRRGKKPYRPRTDKALKNKWHTMLHDLNAFLACDIRASYIIRRSGATVENFRTDAKRFYVEKWRRDFTYETTYDYLKSKKKWLRDQAQSARGIAAEQKEEAGRKRKRGSGYRKKDNIRAEDSGTEDSGEKVPGQKLARRLLKEQTDLLASNVVNDAKIAAEQATFTQQARLHQESIETEQSRITIEMKREEGEREREDNRIMLLDLTGLPDFRIAYFEKQMKAAVDRQTVRDARKVTELVAAQVAAEKARVAAAEALVAANVAADRAAESRLATEAVVSDDVADAADRANAARLVREDLGPHTVVDEAAVPVEVSSDDEDDDDATATSQEELLKFANEVDVMAAAVEDEQEEDFAYLGLPEMDTIPISPESSA